MRLNLKMLSRIPALAVALAMASTALAEPPASRSWTNTNGKTLTATLTGIDGASVQLRLTDTGKVFTVPINSLSPDDQVYIREMRDQGYGVKADRWPAELRPMMNFTPAIVAASDGLKAYETPHYRFVSDVELAPSLIKEYSTAFEGTFHALKTLPLKLNPSPPAEEGRFEVRLFRSRQEYLNAGGPEGSGGVYITTNQRILVPLSSLGVRDQGNKVAIDRRRGDSSTLVHEITHQVMHEWLEVLPIWFVEGIAEYMSAVPLKEGQFTFRDIDRGMTDYLTNSYGIEKNSKGIYDVDVALPGDLMSLSHREWNAAVAAGRSAGLNYRSAMILIYYFIHLDNGQADASTLVAYLQNARGKSTELRNFVAEYNAAVDAYNAKANAYKEQVEAYNMALNRFRDEVDSYNSRVRDHNAQIDQGVPEADRVKVGPKPMPPVEPVKPEVPKILEENPNGGGEVSMSGAEEEARKALYKGRSNELLFTAMQSAFLQRKINLRPVRSAGIQGGGIIPLQGGGTIPIPGGFDPFK